MANNKICEQIIQIALPIAQEVGCTVYDVEYKKEGAEYVLRVILDTVSDDDEYISIDMCEQVSRKLSDALDIADPISGAYMLEVCSPGLDRPLKKPEDFERFFGRNIDIGLYKAIDGSKTLCGELKGFEDGVISVFTDEEIKIPLSETAYVKLAVEFQNTNGRND